MGGKWPYRCCLIGSCFQDLFKIAPKIYVEFPFSFFSLRFVSVQVVHSYSSTDTDTTWKKSCFILSDRSDFHAPNNLSIAVNAIAMSILTSLSADEILLPGYVNGLLILEVCFLKRRLLLVYSTLTVLFAFRRDQCFMLLDPGYLVGTRLGHVYLQEAKDHLPSLRLFLRDVVCFSYMTKIRKQQSH